MDRRGLERPNRSLSADLRLRGDRLRLLGEERNCRRGDTDLRLSGERLTLRRAGLVSRDLPAPSTRGRFLEGESLRRSFERLCPLLTSDLFLGGEWLSLELRSAEPDGGWLGWRSLWRGEELRRR